MKLEKQPSRSNPSPGSLVILILLLVMLGAIPIFVALGYYGYLQIFERIVPGVSLGDLDLTWKQISPAAAEINTEWNVARKLTVSDGVRIIVKKGIPAGAGLGGGSADAGCVLRELPRYWNKEVPKEDLAAIALKLGSDVPYFLTPGTALGQGRGQGRRPHPRSLQDA